MIQYFYTSQNDHTTKVCLLENDFACLKLLFLVVFWAENKREGDSEMSKCQGNIGNYKPVEWLNGQLKKKNIKFSLIS